MGKFGKNYGAHIISEFQASYLDYDKLKIYIHRAAECKDGSDSSMALAHQGIPTTGGGGWYGKLGMFHPHGEHFESLAALFRQEFLRIEDVYISRLHQLETEFADVRRSAQRYLQTKSTQSHKAAKAAEVALKRILTAFHKELTDFESYRLLNFTACIKILKKHDKLLCPQYEPLFEKWSDELHGLKFGSSACCDLMIDQVERLYADVICEGDLMEAHGKLRMSKGDYKSSDVFSCAFKAGVLLTLMVWMMNITIINPELAIDFYSQADASVYIYTFTGAFVVYRWVWGILAYLWELGKVKYVTLFDLDDSKHVPNYVDIISNAISWSILYMANIIFYYSLKTAYLDGQKLFIPAWMLPLSLTVSAVSFLLFASLQRESHGLLSRGILYDFFHPLTTVVTIRHIFAADVMTSMCKVFIAMCYSSCYYYSGTFLKSPDRDQMNERFEICLVSPIVHHASVLVCVIPFMIRLLQCCHQQHDSLVKNGKISYSSFNFLCCFRSNEPDSSVKSEEDSIEDPREEDCIITSDFAVDEVVSFNEDITERRIATLSIKAKPSLDNNSSVTNILTPRSMASRRKAHIAFKDLPAKLSPMKSSKKSSSRPKLSRSESREVLDRLNVDNIIEQLPSPLSKFLTIVFVWPYTFNIIKYSLSIIVVVLGAYPPPVDSPSYTSYICSFYAVSVLSTLYSCYWDFKNDWGLFQKQTDWPLLRPQLKYENMVWFYYLCLVMNPIFRLFWTLSFSPTAVSPLLSLFELLRRCMWGVLRLEWAQINEDKKDARLLVDLL